MAKCPCKDRTLTKHHRKEKALGGSDKKENISLVPSNSHRAWHGLFDGIKTPEQIAQIINDIWLDPDWELVARRVH